MWIQQECRIQSKHKNWLHFYTQAMNMWKQIKNIMALAIIKKMKVLSADIVKYIQDLYAYNNKMLMEKIKHLNKQR